MQPSEGAETKITAGSRRPLNLVDPQTGLSQDDHDQGQDKDQGQGQGQGASHDDQAASIDDASHYEQKNVHEVYDAIAEHFSATRYAPWPLVAQFLAAQPDGSIGLDVGCGNGKYLSGASGAPPSASSPPTGDPQLFILGSDRSPALAKFAYEKHAQHQVGADVLLADSLALPFRDQCADFIICIAVVHHLSTRERRQAAVGELLRCVRRPDMQQDKDMQQRQPQPHPPAASSSPQTPPASTTATTSTPAPSFPPSPSTTESSFLPASSSTPTPSSSFQSGRVLLYVWALEQASSRRGWAAGGEQDLLVPWVKTMRDKNKPKDKGGKKGKKQKQEGTDKNESSSNGNDNSIEEEGKKDQEAQQPHAPPTFHRYYHLYKQGELEDDVAAVGGRVVASGYEKDNWWVAADPL